MAQGSTLLVTGAGGQLGRRVVEVLLESGAGPIIATTRDPGKLGDLAAQGVDVRQADFDAPDSLEAAFKGADRLLLISTASLDPPGLRIRQHGAAIAAAEAVGVKHIVYTSAVAPLPQPEGGVMDDHFWTEQQLIQSKLTWTILRHSIYTDMLLLSLPQAVATGQIFSAIGNGGRNYVTREDCARTDAAALAGSSAEQRIYDVNGPGPITQDELAEIVSEIIGRRIAHRSVPAEGLRQGLTQAGLPPVYVDATVVFDVAASQGYHAVDAPTVKELTGREPTTVREFLSAHREALLPRD